MPKGDADNLRADLGDNFARVANLFLEGLCCAPLSASEYAVVLFVIRRTYGWAKANDPSTGKLDAITADEVSQGTAIPRSTIHKSMQSLLRSHIIIREPAKAGNYYMYGMNCDISQWGLSTPEWKTCKQQMMDARDNHIYNRKRTEDKSHTSNRVRIEVEPDETGVVSPKTDIGLSENGYSYIQNPTEVGAISPTATGAEGTLTEKETEKGQRTSKDSVSGAARKKQRQDELCERRDTLLASLPGADKTLVQAYLESAAQKNKSGTQTLGGEVSKLEEILALREELQERDPAHGLERWRHGMMTAGQTKDKKTGTMGVAVSNFVKVVAEGWSPGDAIVAGPGQKRGRGTGIVTNPDGSVDQERNWTEEQKFGVALARSEKGPKPGTTGWDEERGIAYDSAHHPDNPHYAEWLAEQNAPPKPKRGEPGYVMPPMPPLPDLTVLI
jgi:phage replication O-like protein O